jgi:hypothetical protein
MVAPQIIEIGGAVTTRTEIIETARLFASPKVLGNFATAMIAAHTYVKNLLRNL